MKRIILGLAVTLAMGSALAQDPTPAVVVRADAGTVQVQGSGLVPLNESTGARVGDTITVTEGTAKVTYADGCIVDVVNSHLITAVSPCKAGLQPSSSIVAGDGLLVAAGIGALVVVGVAVGSGGSDSASSP